MVINLQNQPHPAIPCLHKTFFYIFCQALQVLFSRTDSRETNLVPRAIRAWKKRKQHCSNKMATNSRSQGGITRVLLKLNKSIDEGNYYEAHQMIRTLYFRWVFSEAKKQCTVKYAISQTRHRNLKNPWPDYVVSANQTFAFRLSSVHKLSVFGKLIFHERSEKRITKHKIFSKCVHATSMRIFSTVNW